MFIKQATYTVTTMHAAKKRRKFAETGTKVNDTEMLFRCKATWKYHHIAIHKQILRQINLWTVYFSCVHSCLTSFRHAGLIYTWRRRVDDMHSVHQHTHTHTPMFKHWVCHIRTLLTLSCSLSQFCGEYFYNFAVEIRNSISEWWKFHHETDTFIFI